MKDMNNIEYKELDFLGYPKYRVGTDGSIWSYRKNRWKLLKPKKNSGGYLEIHLYNFGIRKCFSIHKLVLLAFTKCESKHLQCRHLDGNKFNNNLYNLKWGTPKENAKDRELHNKTAKGEMVGLSKLTDFQVLEIRHLYKTRCFSQLDLANAYLVSDRCIGDVLSYKTWKHIK